MTDNIPTFTVDEIFPDGADPVDEALAQLREPHHLLAEALVATRAAQALPTICTVLVEGNPAEAPVDPDSPTAWRHRRLLDEAFQLSQIAKIAGELAVAERASLESADFDEADMELRTVPPADLIRHEGPRAINGVRFTAKVTGRYLGTVGHAQWIWTEGVGFIDVTDANQVSHPDAAGVTTATFSGTVRSVAGVQALCVTDGGASVALPRALLTESPDE